MAFLPFVLAALCIVATARPVSDKIAPSVSVNMDLPPKQRWLSSIRTMLSLNPFSTSVEPVFTVLAALLAKRKCFRACTERMHNTYKNRYPEAYEELIGVHEELKNNYHANITLDMLAAGQYFYEVGHMINELGKEHEWKMCTSIVAKDAEGVVVHGRNLDFPIDAFRKNHANVDFYQRNEKVISASTMPGGDNGINTFTSYGAFSVSLNWRTQPRELEETLQCFERKNSAAPLSLFLRNHALNRTSYTDFIKIARNIEFCNAMYLTVAGAGKNQGAIITTAANGTVVNFSDFSMTREWFLVQDNTDRWETNVPEYDDRRGRAEAHLRKLGQKKGATAAGVYEALSVVSPDGVLHGVLNSKTVYTGIMEPFRRTHSTTIRNCTTI